MCYRDPVCGLRRLRRRPSLPFPRQVFDVAFPEHFVEQSSDVVVPCRVVLTVEVGSGGLPCFAACWGSPVVWSTDRILGFMRGVTLYNEVISPLRNDIHPWFCGACIQSAISIYSRSC